MGRNLNEYFSMVFTTEKDQKTRTPGKVNGDVLRIVCIVVEEVLDVLISERVDMASIATLWEASK